MADGKLTKDAQIFVVQQLAMYERPVDVQAALKELFEVEIALSAVIYYDIANPTLPKKWKALFNKIRKKFTEDTSSIGIAQKSYRLRELDKIYQNQKSAKMQNTKAMKDTLEQAAKESGDVFTNKHKIEGELDVQHSVVRVPAKISPEEWKRQSQSEK